MIGSFGTALSVFTRTYGYLGRSRRPGADIEILKRDWALETLTAMGVKVQVIGEPYTDGPLVMVGNHISYLDIPLLMGTAPGVSFLSKSEIRSWPIIGYGAEVIGTTFVKREDGKGRASAKNQIGESLQSGARVVLFPAGTTSTRETQYWRKGAFEIAAQYGVPLQPFRLRYSPLRVAAFIDDDNFAFHLFQLAQARGVDATIEFHPPVRVTNPILSCGEWYRWSRDPLSI